MARRGSALGKDELHLPADTKRDALPTNAPTGGWGVLDGEPGVAVTLPSTAEEHFRGKPGFHSYSGDEYFYAGSSPQLQNALAFLAASQPGPVKSK